MTWRPTFDHPSSTSYLDSFPQVRHQSAAAPADERRVELQQRRRERACSGGVAEQAFRNLQRVLEAGGSGLDRIVKVTIFLTHMANFPKIVALRGRWFSEPYPADTIVEVGSLALPELEIEIEIEAIAIAG